MSFINGVNGAGGINPLKSASPAVTPRVSATPTAPVLSDRVELSGVRGYLDALSAGSDVRTDKVASVRQAIESGKYEDDYKLDVAVDRLIDDLYA